MPFHSYDKRLWNRPAATNRFWPRFKGGSRFFRTLKQECTDRLPLITREQLKNVVFEFVEVFYNCPRIRSALGYLTPEDFEVLHADQRYKAA